MYRFITGFAETQKRIIRIACLQKNPQCYDRILTAAIKYNVVSQNFKKTQKVLYF